MSIRGSKLTLLLSAVALFLLYSLTSPKNHSEAEDVYDFALKVEQGSFADQAGVNRVLALPMFGTAYKAAQVLGYSGRAFPFMVFLNRFLAVACVLLFWKLVSCRRRPACLDNPSEGIKADAPRSTKHTTSNLQLPTTLLLAFSYGFWRYANEAETYILAGAFVLGAWCLAVRGRTWWCVAVSALGVLVHLLNLIPLLLVIPLYYLLSRDWKKALLHGAVAGLLVLGGYAICSPWLDFSELGAQHHAMEGGLGLKNLLRGTIAFGQCLVSGNFLFGFEPFRELLVGLFPSRMLDEEFFMAAYMAGWIKWAGIVTLSLVAVGGLLCVLCGKAALECGVPTPLSNDRERARKERRPAWKEPFFISCFIWLVLYALAVIRTEAGSPELWIMALIPFWLLVDPLWAHRADATTAKACRVGSQNKACRVGSQNRLSWALVAALFAHNLIAGLLPVMPASTDYHQAKGKWLVENITTNDLILTSYEPVMIFYLDYFSGAELLNSGRLTLDEMEQKLGTNTGNVYAFGSFFEPMKSMRIRSPNQYARMRKTGDALRSRFEKVVDDQFGGIFRFQKESEF